MDVSYCSSLQLQENSFLLDSLLDKPFYDPAAAAAYDPASDPGYFSAGSSLSPTSSVDSFCFSPASVQQDALERFIFGAAAREAPGPETAAPYSRTSGSARKSRSRYPGKKRETASEREKLRMRDLTKALHHLRSFLPPSLAPAGQTLTKIETLRLAAGYISHLSAQLGLSQEAPESRSSNGPGTSPQTLNQFLGQTTDQFLGQTPNQFLGQTTDQFLGQTMDQFLGQTPSSFGAQESSYCSVSIEQQQNYQVPSSLDFSSEQLWFPQQQLQHFTFSGNC